MKTCFTSLLVTAALSVSALEIEKRFTTPMVSHRPNIDESEADRVRALLDYMKEELTFMEGGRAPQFEQVQRFGGSAMQTSHFIGMLKAAGLWEIQVRFRDFGEQESAFMLIDHSPPVVMTVEVNSGREDFLLKHFAEHLSFSESGVATDPTQLETERGDADQPATDPGSKPEGDEKPEPEAEGRSQ